MGKSIDEVRRQNDQSLTFLQVLTSSIMAGLGVQSNHIRERDFTKGNVIHFVIAGVLLTAAFLFGLIGIVSLIV